MTKSGNSMEQENNVTKDDSEWEVVKEPYINSINNELMEKVKLKRKDGSTISIAGGAHRGLDDIFLVKGNFGEFKFLASRMEQREPIGSEYYIISDAAPYVVSDTYIVWVNWSVDINTAERDKKLRVEYSKDIESALLCFPVEELPLYNNIPVKDVVFDIGKKLTQPHYVHANDIRSQ